MGFGILLIGYLITFVIWLTVQAINVGSVALLLGYALMFYALSMLNRYHDAFALARWIAAIQLLPALWFSVVDASSLFGFVLPPLWADHVNMGVTGASFALEILFLLSLLYAIRALADSIELKHISLAAVRNAIFVIAHAVLSIVADLPFLSGVKPYLTASRFLVELVVIVSMALLLLGCAKNICREGDEDVTPMPSRFGWVNRMTDAYERTHKRLNEQAKADGEAFMRRRREKLENKNQTKKRKKKK